jgi:hypothetical protein
MYEIRHYLTRNQKDVYMEWRRNIRDTNHAALACGNFGSTLVQAIESITQSQEPK